MYVCMHCILIEYVVFNARGRHDDATAAADGGTRWRHYNAAATAASESVGS